MLKKLFLLTLTSGFIFNASLAQAKLITTDAEDCSPIDFRKTFPMKIRDQQGLSWCYAHAAADYLQYTYQLNDQLSAADIAINYAQSDWSKVVTFFTHLFSKKIRGQPAQTGFIKGAINRILPQGYCPESAFPSDFWLRTDAASKAESKESIVQAIMDTLNLQNQVYEGVIDSPTKMPYSFHFKNIQGNDYFQILKTSTSKNVLENLRQAACKNERRPFPDEDIAIQFKIKNKHAMERINSSFDDGMPASIDFFSGMFKNVDHFPKSIDDLHTVLLYGRTYDHEKQECVYLMKNSYGELCNRYDSRITCDQGYLWIPESILYKSMVSQTLIQRE